MSEQRLTVDEARALSEWCRTRGVRLSVDQSHGTLDVYVSEVRSVAQLFTRPNIADTEQPPPLPQETWRSA